MLYSGFVDLEKALDRALREVIRWAMRMLGVEEWLSREFRVAYHGSCCTHMTWL